MPPQVGGNPRPPEPQGGFARAGVVSTVVAALTVGCGSSGNSGAPKTAPTATPTPTPTPRPKPNFVFILTDDLDAPSVPFMRKTQALLIQKGVSFSNVFCANPISAPARATLLTGLHSHNHGVFTNTQSFSIFRNTGSEQRTVARYLKEGGYRTALIGKSINHYIGEDGWAYFDTWQSFFPNSGDECSSCVYYNYTIRDGGRVFKYGQAPEDYLTDVLTTRAVTYLQDAATQSQPFFLWFATSAPHNPSDYPARFSHDYDGEIAPRTPSFNEADMNDKPSWQRNNLPLLDNDDVRDVDSLHRHRLKSLLAVDDAIERVIKTLSDTGKLANTYVILTSDNGFLLGQHRVASGKGLPYENALRVPLIVRGPDVPEGVTLPHLVSNVDIAPTILDLAQVAAPNDLDGRVSTTLLRANPPPASGWRQEVLLEGFAGGEGSFPEFHGLRTTTASYVEYFSTEIELYDLTTDPDQTDNASGRTPAATLAQWSSRLSPLRACKAAACR